MHLPPYSSKLTNTEIDRHFLVTETRDHSIIVFQEQYRALRSEIMQRQQRRFVIFLGAIVGIPGLSGFSFSSNIATDLVLIAPAMIVAISYLFILENNSIARAGHFLEISVENFFKQVPGWEHYLHESPNDFILNNAAARGAQYSFKLLMIAYYVGAVGLSLLKIQQNFETYGSEIGLVYFLAATFLAGHWLHTTRESLGYSAQLQKTRLKSASHRGGIE